MSQIIRHRIPRRLVCRLLGVLLVSSLLAATRGTPAARAASPIICPACHFSFPTISVSLGYGGVQDLVTGANFTPGGPAEITVCDYHKHCQGVAHRTFPAHLE